MKDVGQAVSYFYTVFPMTLLKANSCVEGFRLKVTKYLQVISVPPSTESRPCTLSNRNVILKVYYDLSIKMVVANARFSLVSYLCLNVIENFL